MYSVAQINVESSSLFQVVVSEPQENRKKDVPNPNVCKTKISLPESKGRLIFRAANKNFILIPVIDR